MSTFSTNLFSSIQNAIDASNHNYPVQLVRFCISAATTVPMFFSDRAQIRLVAVLLLFIVLVASALNHSLSTRQSAVEQADFSSVSTTHALTKFLIPTTSVWRRTYPEVACSVEQTSSGKHLRIKLETIFRDFRRGIIELRDASSDLPRLFQGHLRLDGWNFKLDVSWKIRARTWTWILSNELSLVPEEGFPSPCRFADESKTPTVERIVLKHYCSLFFNANDDVIIWPSLDTIPRGFVQQFIRTTQEALKSEGRMQKTSVLSFTASGAGLSILDDTFVYAALPLSRALSKSPAPAKGSQPLIYNSDTSEYKPDIPLLFPRSSTPLFTRLPDVLSLLTSGPNALHVLSLSNASASYASALDAYADALEFDDVVRGECIKGVGIQGWREERLYARWEAAVLRAGLLARWVVLLELAG